MEKKISRRTFIRKVALFLGAALVSSPIYSFFGERNRLRIKEVDLYFDRLPKEYSSLRMVQFSDTHLGFYFDDQNLQRVVDRINSCKPDIVCFTGDFVDDQYESLMSTVPILEQLDAPLGKYAVLGNHDYWNDPHEVESILSASGFRVLKNENVQIHKDEKPIYIAGVDDVLYGSPNIEKSLDGIGGNDFTIMLAHEPDYADVVSDYSVDLQLSGHSHGGQIRLPLLGHIVAPPLGKKYVDGLNRVKNLMVYTNRGIGTTTLPFRFFCRPEITVLNLKKG
jgi:predicted MPP superfamily phosphohydrolase